MGIAMIHGFLKEKQTAKPEWGSITISEVVLVEMSSATENMVDLLGALPASPNSVTATNPKGISFTIDLSEHPESSAFLLRTVGEIKQSNDDPCFWEIPLNYAVQSFWELTGPAVVSGGANNPRQRRDQRAYKVPTDRPVVWNKSTSLVSKETYRTSAGAVILHTNGLPITEPFKYDEVHETHSFSYNIDYTTYTDSNFTAYIGRVNTATTLGFAIGDLRLNSMTANEEYESLGEGVAKTEYHYVRVTFVFEYNPSGWDEDAKLVSMSTLQQIPGGFLVRIRTSATEWAESPWPLDANGLAIPYNNIDPTDFGYVSHGYPRTADLTQITTAVIAGTKTLTIP